MPAQLNGPPAVIKIKRVQDQEGSRNTASSASEQIFDFVIFMFYLDQYSFFKIE